MNSHQALIYELKKIAASKRGVFSAQIEQVLPRETFPESNQAARDATAKEIRAWRAGRRTFAGTPRDMRVKENPFARLAREGVSAAVRGSSPAYQGTKELLADPDKTLMGLKSGVQGIKERLQSFAGRVGSAIRGDVPPKTERFSLKTPTRRPLKAPVIKPPRFK